MRSRFGGITTGTPQNFSRFLPHINRCRVVLLVDNYHFGQKCMSEFLWQKSVDDGQSCDVLRVTKYLHYNFLIWPSRWEYWWIAPHRGDTLKIHPIPLAFFQQVQHEFDLQVSVFFSWIFSISNNGNDASNHSEVIPSTYLHSMSRIATTKKPPFKRLE